MCRDADQFPRVIWIQPTYSWIESLDLIYNHTPVLSSPEAGFASCKPRPIAPGTSPHLQHSFLALLAMALEERELLVAIDRE